VTTAALAVCAPLLDLSLPLARLAPWATLPHAAVLVAVVASRQGRRAGDRVLAARLERAERELGFARRTGAAAIVCAAAVHELKGLLASLRVASQFAAASADPDAKDRALALLVEALGDGQGRAAGLLGELERSEREEPRGVEVVALLEEVSRACPRAASQPTAGLVVEAPRDLAVRARRGEIELALGCLVRNALSASAPGATVWLRGMECEGGAQIEVSDAAGGIPLDLRAGLFEAPEAPREGLGLLLASRLFEQNGGRVEYLSAQGASCFRVFLPALVDAACEPLL
jgi:signal transduction histidine kinase